MPLSRAAAAQPPDARPTVMLVPRPETPEPRCLDCDQEAVDWARAAVQREIDQLRQWQEQDSADADQWRKFANLLEMKFIGGEGCVIAAFDERRPTFHPHAHDAVVS